VSVLFKAETGRGTVIETNDSNERTSINNTARLDHARARPGRRKKHAMNASSLVAMVTSMVMMDATKTPYEKLAYSVALGFAGCLLAQFTRMFESSENTVKLRSALSVAWVRLSSKVFRKPSGCVTRKFWCKINGDTMSTHSTEEYCPLMYDIQIRVKNRVPPWTFFDIEQESLLTVVRDVYAQLPSTHSFVSVGKDYPDVQVKNVKNVSTVSNTTIQGTAPKETEKIVYSAYVRAPSGERIDAYMQHCLSQYEAHVNVLMKVPHTFEAKKHPKDQSCIVLNNNAPFLSTKTFDNTFFDAKDVVLSALDKFARSRHVYERLGIPYTKAFLLHGHPGTGKTSMIKAIANHTKRHILLVSTKHIRSVDDFKYIFHTTRFNGTNIPMEKRLYVFEEIDCGPWKEMVTSRALKQERDRERRTMLATEDYFEPLDGDNEEDDSKDGHMMGGPSSQDAWMLAKKKRIMEAQQHQCNMTLGEFLEVLDGMVEMPGRMIVFTTNRVDVLDPAILRPGRVDHVLEVGKLKRAEIEAAYRFWFGRDLPAVARENMCPDGTFTQAEIGKLFLSDDMDHIHASLSQDPKR